MRLTQYTKAERTIAAADGNGIHDRWMYGLRLLRDPAAMSANGGGMKHGVAEQLIAAATGAGLRLSKGEIRRRIQCAKAYPTEAQIDHAMIDFRTWFALIKAGFPPVDRPDGEPDADHRTDAERHRLAAIHAQDITGEQAALFNVDELEPTAATVKDLIVYHEAQAAMTARYAERDAERAEYIATLRAAVDDDLETTWADAHHAAFPDDTEEPELP